MRAYERLLEYVKVKTPSSEENMETPSSSCQFELAERLVGEMKELGLDEPHPAGTAGGEHGPGVLIPVGEALHKLAALRHDGQVGGEIGVEYIVKAHLLQGGDHALGGGVLGL